MHVHDAVPSSLAVKYEVLMECDDKHHNAKIHDYDQVIIVVTLHRNRQELTCRNDDVYTHSAISGSSDSDSVLIPIL